MWRKFIINSQIFSSCWRTIVEDKIGTGPLLVWPVNRVDKWKNGEAFQLINCFFAHPFLIRRVFKTPAKRMEFHIMKLLSAALLKAELSRLILNILLFYGPPFDVSTRQVSTSPDLQVFVPVYDKISPNKIRPRPSLLSHPMPGSRGWHGPGLQFAAFRQPTLDVMWWHCDVFIWILFCHDGLLQIY